MNERAGAVLSIKAATETEAPSENEGCFGTAPSVSETILAHPLFKVQYYSLVCPCLCIRGHRFSKTVKVRAVLKDTEYSSNESMGNAEGKQMLKMKALLTRAKH